METITFTRTAFSSRFLFPLAFIAFAILLSNNIVQADGKLRRVKEAVRKHQSKPVPKPDSNRDRRNESRENPKPSHDIDESDHDDVHHEDHHSQRISHRSPRNNRKHHGSSSSGFLFFSQPRIYREPVVVPVVCQTAVKPVPQFIEAPTNELISVVSVEPGIQEIGAEEDGFGSDWFETSRSRFWATIGSDFDGITTGGLGLHLQSPGSVGLEGSVMTLRESTELYRDHLWIGDVNLVYEVLARGDVRGRIGLGVNWLSDSWGAEAGFNLTAGVDLRLTERLILSAEGDIGNLGDADFLHGRVNLARRFEACEWMLGADHFNMGGAEVNSFFTGIQFRF